MSDEERDALIRERDGLAAYAKNLHSGWSRSIDAALEHMSRAEDAESLCSALMTAGLEECGKLREEYEFLKGCVQSIKDSLHARGGVVRHLQDERGDLLAQLEAMTAERDALRATICWNVECAHQAKALDVAARAEEELDESRSVLCARIVALSEECEQLQVQLAGCGAAALGYEKEPAKPGDYGWSASYNDTVVLRRMYDEARERVDALEGAASEVLRHCGDGSDFPRMARESIQELRRVARKGGE